MGENHPARRAGGSGAGAGGSNGGKAAAPERKPASREEVVALQKASEQLHCGRMERGLDKACARNAGGGHRGGFAPSTGAPSASKMQTDGTQTYMGYGFRADPADI